MISRPFEEDAAQAVVSQNSALMKSRGFSLVELEDTAESFAHANTPTDDRGRARRKRNDVVEALVIALHVIVLDERGHDAAPVSLAERHDVPKTLLPSEPTWTRSRVD
jgi:hypothetical protein